MNRILAELDPRSRAVTARGLMIALITPLVAVVSSIALGAGGPASAIALFMLAIVIAAVSAGLWSGLIAAMLSSVAIPFLLSTPRFSVRLVGTEHVVTAVVFLAVAVVMGLLVGSASEERARAARREREARLLGYLSTRLLSGAPPDRVVDEFARLLLEPFGLASCEITVELEGSRLHARAESDGVAGGGPTATLPLMLGSAVFGSLELERPLGRRPLTRDELLLTEAAAKQAAAALDRARLDARARTAQLDAQASQVRAAMFSSVTHDLRSPLTSIKAGVTSLLDRTVAHDEAQQRELLTTILEETDRLNRLVGNILDLTKIRAGALIANREPSAMDEIVEAVVARLKPRLGAVRLETDLDEALPEIVVDPMQMDQVLTNLLENAARHSPPSGEIRVTVSSVRDTMQIRVSDQGSGIPAEERERVFEAFYRGSTSPETPGSGLGLAIVRAIVQAHGGRIWIEGAPGGGACVIFEIPEEGPAA